MSAARPGAPVDGSTARVWHPFTQHALQPPLPLVTHAEGAYLTTAGGERILDAISSWWVITHGHRHPRIVAAIQAQIERLDQIIFAEFTHEPAERLAAALLQIAPSGLAHVFYCDSGAISVEVAVKMALGYWRHRGDPRHRILVLEHSYHGDTIGAMSLSARGSFTEGYEPLLFEPVRIPFPHIGREELTLQVVVEHCRRGDVAALLIEPLVLGAGGMLMYAPGVLTSLSKLCSEHGVLLIADEVMTGWGRTGTLFACEQAGVVPDILCCSKGLTGGALPLAATLCTRAIFSAHYAPDRRRTLFHSSSFTANPIACAAALANIEIWQTEPVLTRIADLTALQAASLQRFRDDARVEHLRQSGTITALDLKVSDPGYLSQIGPRLQESFRAARVLLRPLGHTLYVLPPYCVSAEDLRLIYEAIAAALDAIA
jgi:adenosylmethionine-8-amino-7-oxononanoate aminotransferase